MDVEYLSGLLKLLEKLQATKSEEDYLKKIPLLPDLLQGKDIDPKQKDCCRQIENHIGPIELLADALRLCQSKYGCHNEYTHRVIDSVADTIWPYGVPNDMLWLSLADTRFINELKRWIKEASTKPAETKQDATPANIINISNFQGIMGNVHQPEDLQIGNHASINKHGEKVTKFGSDIHPEKPGIWGCIWMGLKKTWKFIAGTVVFLSALFACIHYWPEIQQKFQSLFSH